MEQPPAAPATDPRLEIARTNIRMATALRGSNYSEVSVAAGLSRNALSQFVNGRTVLSYGNMLKICDVLRVPIAILHRPDAITEQRVRLYNILDRLPDHLAQKAIQEIQAEIGPDTQQ